LQNIDLLLFVQPIVSTAVVVGAILLWRRRSGFRAIILLFSALAYWTAIGAKAAISYLAAGPIESAYGATSLEYALFLGLQTVFFEVGLAYAVSSIAFRRRSLSSGDAAPFGLSLAFWENGVLLGVLSIVDLAAIYFIIASGSPIATQVYATINATSPGLFSQPSVLLPGVLLGTLERISSTLAHLSWGVLCVLSVTSGKKKYLGYALPMGLLDSLVPFAPDDISLFEGVVFALSLLFLAVAAVSCRAEKKAPPGGVSPPAPSGVHVPVNPISSVGPAAGFRPAPDSTAGSARSG